MRKLLLAALILVIALPLFSQAPATKWTVGTVMAVKPHVATAGEAATSDPRFDITVRVGRTDYVVLYTQRPGTADVEYSLGRDAPVVVGPKTLTFVDKVGNQRQLPILSRKAAPPPSPR